MSSFCISSAAYRGRSASMATAAHDPPSRCRRKPLPENIRKCFAMSVRATLAVYGLASCGQASAEAIPSIYQTQTAAYVETADAGTGDWTADKSRGVIEQGVLTEIELSAMISSGASCVPSIYRTAWPIAHAFKVNPTIVAAIIETESSCNRNAVSSEGARGLMQLMPRSGARAAYRIIYGKDGTPTIADLHNPNANIRLGVAYLSALMDHFRYVASSQARLRLVIAAYNCGPDFIDRRLPPAAAGWDAADAEHWISKHAPRQTRHYVATVLRKSIRYALAVAAVHTDIALVDEASQ